MKRVFSLVLVSALLLTGCSSGATGVEKQKETPPNTEEYTTATPELTTAETTENVDKFGDTLEPFQGEWKESELNVSLIIDKESVNFIYYGVLDNKDKVADIKTFYFDLDSDGELVISNQYSQARFIPSLDENGQLSIQHLTSDDIETYERVGDSTTLPGIVLDPAIGMTESEVCASTWGTPRKRNKTTTTSGEREQWVYKNGYIYFENGIVTAIQKQ